MDLTVVVPAFDVERYVAEALASIPRRSGLEVIVVDDGSSDRTAEVAEDALADHGHARVVRAPHRGAGPARNRALDEATGEWVLFLDADDRLATGAVDTLLAAATSEPEIDVVVADLRRFPAGVGKERFTWQRVFDDAPTTVADAAELEHLVYAAGPANKLFRREAIERIGARFGDTGAFEDGFFTIPMYLGARRIRVVPDVVYEYRVREARDGLMDGLFERPSNYRDHLRLAGDLADRARAEDDPARRRWLERFVVRQTLPFLERAAGVLSEEELVDLAPLVAATFADVDLDVVERFSRRPGRRRAAVAAVTGADLPDPAAPVEVAPGDGAWVLADPYAPSRLQPIPRLAWRATAVGPTDGGVRLTLALTDRGDDRCVVRADELTLTAGDRSVPMHPADGTTWSAVVPVVARATGPLRVTATTATGSIRADVLAGHLGIRRAGLGLLTFTDGHLDVAVPGRPAALVRRLVTLARRRVTTGR